MAWWRRGTGVRLRLWMVVNLTALTVLCYLVTTAVTHQASGDQSADAATVGSTASRHAAKPTPPVIPTMSQLLNPTGIYYGVATPSAPWSGAEVAKVAEETGARPSMTEYFVKWTDNYDPAAVAAAYRHGTVPVLSWEPWQSQDTRSGAKSTLTFDTDQPKYRLARIADGAFDPYIQRFARAVAAAKMPVVLRFAHEMNGTWYPWSEQLNGNRPGDYVKAWRHVHDLFVKAGATNVIWVWSPNIVRPTPKVKLAPLYPGDAYVDWVGLVGYGNEDTAQATFGPTLRQLCAITHKPIVITETGAVPALKTRWITNFFHWLPSNPDIIGFIWFERDRASGGTADWRFDATAASLRAFRAGVAADRTRLVPPTTTAPLP
ncbi:glycoside hydrolase family 26 protein [Streptacidiphilus neutrinimicus]|uniref:glycoside hydrolase family 26 protein n=1 Tax=Streptacidiphilus neutrinimicus TaxID=105420 RepID=UPI00126A48F3|nr:glycosyl hydrolase [Streptacidiphilus neutrinimicus]